MQRMIKKSLKKPGRAAGAADPAAWEKGSDRITRGVKGVQSARSVQPELMLTSANVLKVPLTQAFSTK